MSLFTLFKSLKLVFKRKKGRSTEAKSLTECNDLLGNFITEKEVRCYKYSNFKAMMKEDHFICAKFEEEFFFLKLLNNDSETISRVIHELELFHNISHRNILKFCGVSRIEGIEGRIINTNKHHILVLEYADSGSLSTYLDKNFDELNWNDKINLAFQLASAVSYLNDKNIIFITICVPVEYYGYRPFRDEVYDVELSSDILSGKREKIIDGTPEEYSKLYTECWNYESQKRPNMQQVVSTLNQLRSSNNFQDNNPSDNATEWIKNALNNKVVNFIPFNELTKPEFFKKGGFGLIMKAIWTKTGNYVVYKKLTNTDAVRNDILDAFIHELKIHLHFDYCDRIVRCFGISQDVTTKEYLLVMQYANGGDLRNYLKDNFKKLTWKDKKRLAFQIADKLNYLHNENVLHRDLHSKNIVIHENNAKIIDFGISKIQNQSSAI
ncbi:unnamed protein product [Rhizophagus irregularis]|nr:unnamed protein product [Rhizophagus irregularis]